MIYITTKGKSADGLEIYRLYETDTGSRCSITEAELIQVMKLNETIVKNMRLVNGKLESKVWFNRPHSFITKDNGGGGCILLCALSNDRFKLVRSDEGIVFVNKEKLIKYTKENRIANCMIEDGKYKAIDYYMATENRELKDQVSKKYARYEAVSAMLGRDNGFEYAIEGDNIELISYTGTDTHVMVPKFVTSISGHAFVGNEVQEVVLEDGIRTIGSFAFSDCNMSKIAIPKTVTYIGLHAFEDNARLLTDKGDYRLDKIKILNTQTVILDKIFKDTHRDRGV